MEALPEDLLLRISDNLSTRDRARLAVTSKGWQVRLTNSWTSIRLGPAPEPDTDDNYHRVEQLNWLNRLAINCQNTLHSLYIHPVDRLSSLPFPEAQLDLFSRLRSLVMQPLQMTKLANTTFAYTDLNIPISLEAMQRLSSLTSLEVLSLRVNKNYDRMHDGRPISEFSLDVFSALPRLRRLEMRVDFHSHTTFTMSPQSLPSGFQNLKSLCLECSQSCDIKILAGLISRLEALLLGVEHPLQDVLSAPNLTCLGFRGRPCLQGAYDILPFKTSASLLILSSCFSKIPQSLLFESYNIASLCLEHTPRVTPTIVRSWSILESLTHLTVGEFRVEVESIMQPFTCLTRLKSLNLTNFMPQLEYHSVLGPLCGGMVDLTRLEIRTEHMELVTTYNVDGMAVRLPALKEFYARLGLVLGEIYSGTLEVLDFRYSRLQHQLPEVNLLGELPCLNTLTLRGRTDFFKEKVRLAHSLSFLPNLRKLSLISMLGGRGCSRISQAHGNTIHLLLQALRAATELRMLKLFIPNSDFTLSGVEFQRLESLAIGCRAVSFDGSSLPCENAFIDIHCMEASNATLENFTACQEMMVDATTGVDWKYINIRRRNVGCSLKDDYAFTLSARAHLLFAGKAYTGKEFPGFLETFFACLQK